MKSTNVKRWHRLVHTTVAKDFPAEQWDRVLPGLLADEGPIVPAPNTEPEPYPYKDDSDMMTLDEVATALPRPEGRSPLARETIRRIEEKALQKLKCLIASKPGVIDRRTGELRYCRDDFFD